MKRVHLLRVEEAAPKYESLFRATAEAELRIGWLQLDKTGDSPPELESAAALGALRAVSVTSNRTVVVKPRRGKAVLEDLLREHFRGCALVLVHGPSDLPLLRALDDRWEIYSGDAKIAELSTAHLVKSLRKPVGGLRRLAGRLPVDRS